MFYATSLNFSSTYSTIPLLNYRGVAQLARASALGAEGRRFESCHPDQSRHCLFSKNRI